MAAIGIHASHEQIAPSALLAPSSSARAMMPSSRAAARTCWR
jgi:hypothetical protein